ncbi:MAG: hypothetical protein QOD27_1204 [Microbacteriaceae bacterium]|jgi:hypothetical protein|nr:hypothetical protein [Microbacteriaceae bacterium]MDQ1549546.1 hypothetical protein [Microbacteriaceae bacterium]MDQ1578997.1 hypothetical protein [Microbacteriaceae bacterium]
MVVSAAVAHRIPAGWYRDRDDRSLRRWWDGVAWTDYYSPYTRPILVSAEAAMASAEATVTAGAPAAAEPAESDAERPLTWWRTGRRYLPLIIVATLIVANVVLTIVLASEG